MMSTGRLRRIGAVAGSSALVVLMVASCTSEESAQPTTATVGRASVTSGVSATGSMSSISQQNLGFPDGGQLTNVFVKVGDRVEAGQVLATVDDFALRQALLQQEGQLRSQQAALDRLVATPVAEGAKDSLGKAEDVVDKTRKNNQATLDAAETAIDNAERQLAVDKDALDDAKDRLARSRDACGEDNPYDVDDSGSSADSDNSGSQQQSGASQQQSGGAAAVRRQPAVGRLRSKPTPIPTRMRTPRVPAPSRAGSRTTPLRSRSSPPAGPRPGRRRSSRARTTPPRAAPSPPTRRRSTRPSSRSRRARQR